MAQLQPSQHESMIKQFIYQYYYTLAYDIKKVYFYYEKYATIYRQNWPTNKPLQLSQCTDSFLFTTEGDHLTILNYVIFPTRQGSLIIVNGQIDSEHRPTTFFNQVLEIEIYYNLSMLIVSDYVQFTAHPQISDHIEYFDVMPPTAEGKEEPKANEAPKQVVNQQPQQQAPLQQQPSQPQQQQEYSNPPNRGRENYRGKGSYRGRNNMQRTRGNRNDNMTDLSEIYGSTQNYQPESNQQSTQSTSKYVPPSKK